MADYINLLGAEEVLRAGGRMMEAAREMKQAATNIDGSIDRLQLFLNDWLDRLDGVLQDRTSDFVQRQS